MNPGKQGRTHQVLRRQLRGRLAGKESGAEPGCSSQGRPWERRGFHDIGKSFPRKQGPTQFQLLMCKELGSCHSHRHKGKAIQSANQWPPLEASENWGPWATQHLNSRDRRTQSLTAVVSLPEAGASAASHWSRHGTKTLGKLPEAEYGLAWVFKTPRTQS